MTTCVDDSSMSSLEAKLSSLTEELIRSYEELNLLYELAESLSTAMTMDDITSLVLEMAWEITGAEKGLIMLRNDDVLFTRQRIGFDRDLALDRGEGLPWKVIDSGTGMVVNDFSSEKFVDENICGVRNSLIVPIVSKERGLGVLMLMDKKAGSFTSMDLKLVGALAAQAALYMDSYLLHEMRMEERLKEQSEIHQEEIEKISQKIEFDDEMIEGFVADCLEPLADVEQQILALEKGVESDVIDGLFRTMHTIKGTAKFFDFRNIADLAHGMEDVFGMLRDRKLAPSAEIIDILMEGLEGLNHTLDEIKERKSDTGVNLSDLIGRLRCVKEGKSLSSCGARPASGEEAGESGKDLGRVRQKPRATDLAVRVPIEKLNKLTGHMQRLNNLTLGYMMDIKTRLDGGEFGDVGLQEATKLDLLLSQVSKMYGDSQTQLMALRNIPIKKLFGRFPKMVRDLSKELGKRIALEISGEDVEIDRTIMDEIGGALVHMVRNAVDHGIETPKERIAAGKAEEGRIKVSGRKDGSEIIITIEDDGKGLDPKKIREKAIAKGIVSRSDAQGMSDRKALQLVFAPGFSTSDKVTDISGRGVGMNVVKEVAVKLNGKVDIVSEVGQGTRFTLRIPSTVGISSVVLVEVADATFAAPSVVVEEVANITGDQIHMVNGKEVVNYRDAVFPLVRLDGRLGVGAPTACDEREMRDKYPLLVVNMEGGKRGFLADRVLGRTEVMVTPFRGLLKDSPFVSGATFLGNMLIPILDINGIAEEGWTKRYEGGDERISFAGRDYDITTEREFIIFELGGEPFGVGFGHLQEIIMHSQEPVRIPGMGEALLGIINLRNSIIPLLDMARLGIGGDGTSGGGKPRILIVGNNEDAVGLLVDSVKEVCRIGDDALERVKDGDILNGDFFPCMAKVDGEIIKIVDIDRIVDYYRRNKNGC